MSMKKLRTARGKTKKRSAAASPRRPQLGMQEDAVVMMDPAKVKEPRVQSRDPSAYEGADFNQLRDSIRACRRNVVPIHVLRAGRGKRATYTLVYGSRRLRACQELGLKVRAMVTTVPVSRSAATDRIFENQARRDLLPIELGRELQAVLVDTGQSMGELAESLNISKATISRATRIANLPDEILVLLRPRQWQYRTGEIVDQLLKGAREAVLLEAVAMRQERDAWSARDVLLRLRAAAGCVEPCNTLEHEIVVAGEIVAVLECSYSNHAKLTFKVPVSPRGFEVLAKDIAKFMRRNVLSATAKTAAR